MPRIAIQVLLYKSSDELPRVVDSLKDQSYTDWKFYVYENSCDPGEYQRVTKILAESGVPHELYTGPVNLGFAGGHNELFKKHEAEFALLLNDDAYLEVGYLEAVITRFETDPSIASVAGPVYRWSAPVVAKEILTDETPVDTLALIYTSLAEVADLGAGQLAKNWKAWIQSPQRVFGVSAAVATYRRSAVLAASIDEALFDPFFFMYKEDVDLAIRLARKGFTSWFEPGAVSFHRRSFQGGKGLIQRLRDEAKRPAHLRLAMYRNQWALYTYHFSDTLGLRDVLRVGRAEILRAVGTFIISPKVYIDTWWQIVTRMPQWLKRRKQFQEQGMPLIRLDTWGK